MDGMFDPKNIKTEIDLEAHQMAGGYIHTKACLLMFILRREPHMIIWLVL